MRASSSAIFLTTTVLVSSVSFAADIKQSTFTQIVNDVKVLEQATKTTKPATPNDIFKIPDMIRTGPSSRAELIAEDKTVTRIGANSIFSFDPSNRTINLEKGSLLFQAPKGKGGGTIKTTSAAASVLGTTMIVTATDDGGFKVLLLEGSGKIKLPSGKAVTLKPGQMVFVLPNGGFSPVVTFKLQEQVEGSMLVNGFANQLPSMGLINLEITRQNKLIANGDAVDTGLLVTDVATSQGVQVIDPEILQQYFHDQETLRGHVTPPPVDPPIDPPVEPPPPPPFFDVVINEDLTDQELVNNDGSTAIEGNNVQVVGMSIDTSASENFDLFIEAANVMEFAQNELNEYNFSSSQFALGDQQLAVEGGVANLYLVAKEFRFPDSFYLSFFGNSLSLVSLNDLTIGSKDSERGARIDASTESGTGGALTLRAARNINLSGNVRLYGNTLSLDAGNNLTMNDGYLGFLYGANLTAANVLTMKGVGFGLSQTQNMTMSAKTIALENISFTGGSSIYLRSEIGELAANPNTGKAVRPGYVNFIRNVTYGGSPAQNAVGEGIFISPLNNNPQRTR